MSWGYVESPGTKAGALKSPPGDNLDNITLKSWVLQARGCAPHDSEEPCPVLLDIQDEKSRVECTSECRVIGELWSIHDRRLRTRDVRD